MAAGNVTKFYQSIIDDVIKNVQNFFIEDGGTEQMLQDLKQSWMNKLNSTEVVESTPAVPDDQQLAYAWNRVSGQPKANMQPQHYVSLGNNNANVGGFNVTPQTFSFQPQRSLQNNQGLQTSRGNPQQWMYSNAVPGQRLQPNNGHHNFHRVNTVPQNAQPVSQAQMAQMQGATYKQNIAPPRSKNQYDGSIPPSSDEELFGDETDDDVEETDNDVEEMGDDVEEPLNSDDDITDEELEDIENLLVCQYEKVYHTKHNWKFQLKDGIMCLDGKDYVFSKASGEAPFC